MFPLATPNRADRLCDFIRDLTFTDFVPARFGPHALTDADIYSLP